MGRDGTWSTPLVLADAGSYRVFADFKRDGSNHTLASDLAVDGNADWRPLPPPEATGTTTDGYEVRLAGGAARAGRETDLRFTVLRNGSRVEVEPYLGAGGHLVALRSGDLAYLHVHPLEGGHAGAEQVAFETEFPTAGRYRLFLQFKHAGRVHTAAFTQEVSR
jgi:hypothetical protein